MRAWEVQRLGEPREALELVEVAVPERSPGEVVIAVSAMALNFPDVLMCQGRYQEEPPLPFTPGLEVAGLIAEADPVSGFVEGQRVAAVPRLPRGGLAEFVSVPERDVLPIPDEMPYAEAAALPIGYHTAHVALGHRAGLRAGETLLVHGGAGGVGSAAIQLGKAAGARVVATATGPDRAAACGEIGADRAIDSTAEDFVSVVKDLTDGSGADVVFDPVGGETFDRSRKCIAFEGRLVTIGFASGTIPTAPVNHVLIKNYSIVGVHWGLYRDRNPALVQTVQSELTNLYLKGDIGPVVGLRLDFTDALEAFDALTSRQVVGKIVLER